MAKKGTKETCNSKGHWICYSDIWANIDKERNNPLDWNVCIHVKICINSMALYEKKPVFLVVWWPCGGLTLWECVLGAYGISCSCCLPLPWRGCILKTPLGRLAFDCVLFPAGFLRARLDFVLLFAFTQERCIRSNNALELWLLVLIRLSIF